MKIYLKDINSSRKDEQGDICFFIKKCFVQNVNVLEREQLFNIEISIFLIKNVTFKYCLNRLGECFLNILLIYRYGHLFRRCWSNKIRIFSYFCSFPRVLLHAHLYVQEKKARKCIFYKKYYFFSIFQLRAATDRLFT